MTGDESRRKENGTPSGQHLLGLLNHIMDLFAASANKAAFAVANALSRTEVHCIMFVLRRL